MRVPVSWLRDFIQSDAPVEAFADALTFRGFPVDAIDKQPMPERIVIGKVETLERHPNADRLLVGKVNVGTQSLQIVTGAENVKAGDKVPIALVGSTVFAHSAKGNGPPNAAETKRIERSTLRGVESNGMMCSPDELALPGEYEDGILIMEEDAKVGDDFWRVARFGDGVLDVDVPSNRADGLSIIGLAREAAAGLAVPFMLPELETYAGTLPSPIGVGIEDPSVCRRLLGQYFAAVQPVRSPMWMVLRLQAAGVRSISLLVDISNFVQLETGQPLHFYDADKVRGGRIVARASRTGETVTTLDGVERRLSEGIPIIADGEGLVGIAGIMGGAESGVTETTRNLFVESPNFVGARIRRASIELGLRSEGATRHERNLPLEKPEIGRRLAAQLVTRLAHGSPSQVVEAGEKPGPLRTVRVRTDRVNALLGSDFSPKAMRASVEAIGFRVNGDREQIVTVPFWRSDVVEEVDLIEEIARGIGYDKIAEVHAVATPQTVDESLFQQEAALAERFGAMGYNEVVNLSLLGSRAIAAWERSGVPFWKDAVAIVNPLSDEQRVLRPSLLPGLLSAASKHWAQSRRALRLFEVGHVFRTLAEKASPQQEESSLPEWRRGVYRENGVREWPSFGGVAVFDCSEPGYPIDRSLLEVKGDVESGLQHFLEQVPETQPRARTYFHPSASGNLRSDGQALAKFGRIHPKLARAYELPLTTYAFLLYVENIPARNPVRRYHPLPKVPATRRDIAVVVDASVSAGDLVQAIRTSSVPYFESVTVFDEYRGPQIGESKKSVALSLTFRKSDSTITDEEANASSDGIVKALAKQFAATLRE